ncbi:MAG TPA: hypothetical protein VIX84_17735 [Acidimicrobiales bacterium]
MTDVSQPQLGAHDSEAGVFVMHCWVMEDGELAGRVQWATVDGDEESRMLGSLTDFVNEAQYFLRRVRQGRHGEEGAGQARKR